MGSSDGNVLRGEAILARGTGTFCAFHENINFSLYKKKVRAKSEKVETQQNEILLCRVETPQR